MIYLLKCPGCRNKMKYSPMKQGSSGRKVCVYCGRSFKVEGNTVKKAIS